MHDASEPARLLLQCLSSAGYFTKMTTWNVPCTRPSAHLLFSASHLPHRSRFLLENTTICGKTPWPCLHEHCRRAVQRRPQLQCSRHWPTNECNKHSALLIKLPYLTQPQHVAFKIRAGFSHLEAADLLPGGHQPPALHHEAPAAVLPLHHIHFPAWLNP